MKLSHALDSCQKYHSFNSKKNTIKNYEFLFSPFKEGFGKRDLESITPDEILFFRPGSPKAIIKPPSATVTPDMLLYQRHSDTWER
jgi:hypothetical protein